MGRGPALALLVFAAAGLVAGWKLFLFSTDDAYIAFRYVSNAMAGHGLVWNPAPFQPVEGYTSFLWVALLWGVWGKFGFEPPAIANWLSLGFGALTLWLVWRIFARLAWPAAWAGQTRRALLFACVLVLTLSNRTFLTWLSSGLETAMFNAWVTWFVLEAVTPPPSGPPADARRLLRLSTAAALAALTRPDGLLLVAGAGALVALEAWRRRPTLLRQAWPMLALPLHTVWRRATYGEWLPNTYQAKYVEAWPESGVRYLASFVLEYGLWVWLALALGWGLRRLRRPPGLEALLAHAGTWVAVGVLLGHFGWYTFSNGGDHFEYRVYSHLVPLLALSGVWLAVHGFERPAATGAVLVLWLAVSLPIPWVHWQATRHLETRAETVGLALPVAPLFPAPLRPLVEPWDALQAWLIGHNVGVRHQEHKVFHRHRTAMLPTREEGARMRWSERNVFADSGVGVVSWVLPGVAILDQFGLNDRVVARLPAPPRQGGRQMAHDRLAPTAYLNCFLPNVHYVDARGRRVPRDFLGSPLPRRGQALETGKLRLAATPRELTDERIRDCEQKDWTWAARQQFGAGAGSPAP
ncbi:MAG: hypothetical protein ACQGVC_22320 [Myxococcota bacterium]